MVGTGCEEWINCDSERWDYSSIYNGCCPEHTLDGDLSTRWSCKEGQEDEPCTLTYHFDDPQDIVMMRIAFHKGNENVRKLKIKINGSTDSVIESSGETLGYQSFMLNTDETQKLSLNPVGLDKDEWISISEVCDMRGLHRIDSLTAPGGAVTSRESPSDWVVFLVLQ